MTRQEFACIIESGQNISVTPQLMAAARESAYRERNEAIRAFARWVAYGTRSAICGFTLKKMTHCS